MNNSKMLYWVSKQIFTFLTKLLLRFHVSGRENLPEPPFILASNHSSIIDPALVGIACYKYRVDFMAKSELFTVPILGAWVKAVGCIEVKRSGNNVGSLKEAIKRLRAGRIVGIFPEGTRSIDGNLQMAKKGTGFIIAKASVPVVPVYVKGSDKAAPKDSHLVVGTEVKVFIGKPVFPHDFPGVTGDKDFYESFAGETMKHIAELKEKCDREQR